MTTTSHQLKKPTKIIARATKHSRPKIKLMKSPDVNSKTARKKQHSAGRSQIVAAPVKVEDAKPRATKKSMLINILQRQGGVAVLEMTELLGWLPHSVRAAMTGLRRDGCHILRTSGKDGLARYRIDGGP